MVKVDALGGKNNVFDAIAFRIDWTREQATCQEGRTNSSWTLAIDNRKNKVVKIKLATAE